MAETLLVEARHGRFFVLKNDNRVSLSMAVYGEWTESEFALLRQVLRPGDTVVDVGANLGCLTVPLAGAVGPQGMVVALEPQPEIFRLLATNTVINGLDNVRLFHAAAGAAPGTLPVAELRFDQPRNYGALSMGDLGREAGRGDGDRREVALVRLDDILAGRPVRLIKIDVEGMESDVLAGAGETIRQHRPFLFIENEIPGEASQRLIALVQSLGYLLYWQMAPQYVADNFKSVKENIFGSDICINMFCVPEELGVNVNGMVQITGADQHPRNAQGLPGNAS